MNEKVKIELEYLFKTSPKILDNMIGTPSGLSEWFADDVNVKDDIYTFFWDDSEEKARVLTRKNGSKIKFQWLKDEGTDVFFELKIEIDDMTNAVIFQITDFADADEVDETKRLWEHSINDLKSVIGA